jgi:outer membrane murein-binding lipoprotein Lpp
VNINCLPRWNKQASEKACGSIRGFPRELPSFYALFWWTILLSALLLMVSGCGRKELEDAKQQINNLTAENQKLTELSASLNKDKNRLNEEIKTLSDKNARMQRDLDDSNKSKAALTDESKKLKDKTTLMEEELTSLKREKSKNAEEIEECKKRLAELSPPSRPPGNVPGEIGTTGKTEQELSPCDSVLAFMKASEQVVRQQKGNERTKSLEQVKTQYSPRMQGAPAKAVKAAEDWVKEGTRFWDKSPDDAVFRMLQLRNIVLDACGKSPDAAGFK